MNDDSSFIDNTQGLEPDKFYMECLPKLEVLEQIREAMLKTFNYRKKMAVPIAAVIVPFFGFIDYWILRLQSGDDGAAGLTFLAMGALWHWINSPKRQYAKAYKEDILPDLAGLFGGFTYDSKGKISMNKMKPTKIVPYHQKYKSEDYFKGQYKGVDIEFCEIKLTKKQRSGKRSRTVTVFKGLAIQLKFNAKRFYGHTIIDKDQGKVSEWFKEKGNKLKRANLVDPEFEKVFDVYTNDQVEARYLIDPVMIEKMTAMYYEYEGSTMAAAFYEEQMLILIDSKHNYFEPADIHTPATTPESMQSMKSEVGKILSIVDKLSLYDPKHVHAETKPLDY